MPFSTRDGYLGLAIQAAPGLPEVTAAERFQFVKFLDKTSAKVETKADPIDDGQGNYVAMSKQYEVVRGQIEANARPDLCAAMFQFCPGLASWSGASSPALHTFVAGQASIPYATMEFQSASGAGMLVGDTALAGLTISGQSAEPLKLSAPVTGLHPIGSVIDGGASYSAEPPFFYYSSPSISVNGVGDRSVESFNLGIGLTLQELYTNGPTLDTLVLTDRDIGLTFTRRYQNSTLWNQVWRNGGVGMPSAVATGSFSGYWEYGSGASLRSLEIGAPLLLYEEDALTELDPDGKTVRETVKAKLASGATSALILKIRNGHASTYGPADLPYPDSPDSYPGRFFPG